MTLAARIGGRKRVKAARPEPQAADLLAWYDRNRRTLPWRALPGERADPYRVWLSEIMLQQTTVKAVVPYFARFTARWPDVESLAAAPIEDVLKLWAGLGYYARARNLHACARMVVECHTGTFPDKPEQLRALPGIGRYTAAAIAAIAYDVPAAAVDGNAERVVARLYAIDEELPAAKPVIEDFAGRLVPMSRPGDFAQALMDLGATICTPKKPACAICPWLSDCAARARGDAELLPRKAAKPDRPLRRGAAFVVIRADQAVLVRQRPPKGLLGGMTEVPTTEWSADFNVSRALDCAPQFAPSPGTGLWRLVPGVVRHVFTHFPLELIVYFRAVPAGTAVPFGARFVPLAELAGEALPSVMRKVIAHALPDSFQPVKRRAPITARIA